MKQFILSILCRMGIHFKEWITIKFHPMKRGKKAIELRYRVCPHCGDGHPDHTGEY